MMPRHWIAFVLLIGIAPAAMPMTCAEFNAQLQKTYGFEPSKLGEGEKAVKGAQMDVIWDAAHAEPATLRPCLKAALSATTDNWFLFDGSRLLMAIDPSKESKELLFRALGRVSLEDVALQVWVAAASGLALEGFNTAPLGKRWLEYRDAQYFLVEHGAYQVDRGNGAMFLYGSMDERFATPALIELVRNAKGEARENAVWMLMSQATPEALEALPKIDMNGLAPAAIASIQALQTRPRVIEPRTPPKTSRAEFLDAFNAMLAGDDGPFAKLVSAVPDGERDLVTVATAEDLPLLRKVRRFLIAKNTPHAIEDYNQFSQILMAIVFRELQAASPK